MALKISNLLALGILSASLLSSCINPVSVIYDASPRDVERVMSTALRHEDGSYLTTFKYDYCKLVAPHVVKNAEPSKMVASACFIKFNSNGAPVHLRAGLRKDLPEALKKLAADVCGDKNLLDAQLEAEHRPATKVSALGMTTLGEENWLIYCKATGEYFLYENADVKSEDCVGELNEETKIKPW